MNFLECVTSSFRNVFSNKMRTFLTMIGIIIGISSVIMIVSIGNGSQAAIEEEFESFGKGSITVSLVSSRDIETRDLMDMDDYYMLSELEGVKYISPSQNGSNAVIKLMNPQETNNASVTGVSGDYRYIQGSKVLYGRYISDNDVEMKNSVCVIEDTTAIKVFGVADDSVIGQKISLKTWKGTNKLTVVGIIEGSTTVSNSSEMPDAVIMPVTTVMKVFSRSMISSIIVTLNEEADIDTMKANILTALSDFHGNEDKYYISDTTEIADSINSILSYVTLFIGFVAAISLLVGGIGVMNIMMVTVTERTREIGIRKAIGAKNRDIRTQFIIEAVILTGIGGFLGLFFGWIGAKIIGSIVGITPVTSVTSIVGAVGISMAIGIIFGVAPANKAAMLDPI